MNEDQIHKNVIAKELMEFLWGMESDAIVRYRKINEECSITTILSVDNSCFTIIKQYEERTESMFIPASLEELFGPRVEKNPEWKDAPNNGEVSIAGEEYMKEGEQWFRLMKGGEKITCGNVQYCFHGDREWRPTVLTGEMVDLNHGRSYRVQCDPPHGALRGTLKPT